MSESLEKGSKLPEFRLQNQDGEWIDSADLRDGKALVIFFYPKNETPGCTKEACKFRDEHAHFSSKEAIVFGVSSDSVKSHKRFHTHYSFPYDLLSDRKAQLRKAFGVPSALFGLIPGRATYIFSPEHKLIDSFISQTQAGQHVDFAIHALETLFQDKS